jgi:GNAT superfamily N-acetyltransferase
MVFDCRSIAAEDCVPLRSEVLRPGQPLDACRFPFEEEWKHFGVFLSGSLISIVSAHPEANFGEQRAWRVRGMATSLSLQGRGAGGAALGALMGWARAEKVPLLWCNAREKAIPFYERHGFTVESELFDLRGVGPHKVMKKLL